MWIQCWGQAGFPVGETSLSLGNDGDKSVEVEVVEQKVSLLAQ